MGPSMAHEEVIIGNARLICGDCREVLPGLPRFDAVITDPPYGVKHNPGAGRMTKIGGGIVGDESPPDIRWIGEHPAVVWGGNNFCDQLPRTTGWLVWDKTHAATCEHSQAELAWTNMTRTVRLHREAYHGFMRGRDGWFHQHQKPPALMEWCMQWTESGATILDPYMGSGTCGISAANTGRKFIGIEIDSRNFDIACERISRAQAQARLFPDEPAPVPTQERLCL